MNIPATSAHEIAKRTGAASGMTQIEGNQIFYEVAGAGPPIVLLHDGLVHRAGFDEQFSFFSKHFTVIRYDRPGYGDSKPPSVEYSHAQTLKSLFDFLGLASAIVIGGSAGGGLALDFTIACPEQVKALVLVGAPVSGIEFSDHMWHRGWKNTWGDSTTEMIDFWVNDPWFVAEENQAAKLRLRELLSSHPHNLENFPVDILDDGHAVDRLSEIDVPTFVVIGEWDIADNHAHSGVIELGIKAAQRKVVPNSGHVVYMEQPQKFNQMVMEFLKGIGVV